MRQLDQVADDGRFPETEGRGVPDNFGRVSEVRKEIFALYREARKKKLPTSEAYSLCQILQAGAKMMVETEPQAELKELRAQYAALEARAHRLEQALLETQTREAMRQVAGPADQRALPPPS